MSLYTGGDLTIATQKRKDGVTYATARWMVDEKNTIIGIELECKTLTSSQPGIGQVLFKWEDDQKSPELISATIVKTGSIRELPLTRPHNVKSQVFVNPAPLREIKPWDFKMQSKDLFTGGSAGVWNRNLRSLISSLITSKLIVIFC